MQRYPETAHTDSDKSSGKAGNSSGETSLLHYAINDRNSNTSEQCWKRPHANVRNMVLGIAVPNLLKVEGAVVSYKPAGGSEHHLRQRRVDVKVVLPRDVV